MIAELAGITEGRLARLEHGKPPDMAYFGPTNVAMYRMTSALERGDSDLAVELAGSVQPAHIASPERHAKHWLDTGRALAARRGREYDAVAAFQRSETLAALRLRSNIYAREAVTGLLPQVRREKSQCASALTDR